MSLLEQAGLRVLRCLDPETAHGLALKALAAGLGPKSGPVTSPRLATTLAGLALPNPVGIAAGFDKNAEVVRAALAAGPGFLEVGAVTPRPQPGNPRPRLFRLAEDRAAINRFGFNNQGMEAVAPRLAARGAGIVGVNLGANKDAADRAQDYVTVLRRLYALADFFTVNVSSPNTEKLRDLQGRAALDALLGRVTTAKAELGGEKPVFLKIAPDLTQAEIADIAELALAHGGLSGQPLFARSTEVLGQLYRLTGGKVPLVGVGGVATAGQAYAKIRAGASAVQLYTAMVYGGIGLPGWIARGLDRLLERDGYGSVAEAVGTGNK
jgi:dihydroorotate dehydrogenase